jgi:iron(III) transport system ATP-binding protein
MINASVAARGLHKAFGQIKVIRGIDLTLAPGDRLSIMGPSGCGKTTLLRLLAGLERPDEGTIEVSGREVAGPGLHLAPEKRRVVLVFQDLALFPHMTVAQNIAFGLRRGTTLNVGDLIERVFLSGLGERFPHELSGGQRQRAAIARALACEPELVLLDEPFANLDVFLRSRIRGQVRDILAESGVASLLMTHDLADALGFSDKLGVMIRGRLVQSGSPSHLYQNPLTPEVAGLLGNINLVPATANGKLADCEIGQVALGAETHGRVLLALRPESMIAGAEPLGPARVVETEFGGDHTLVRVQLRSGRVLAVWAQPESQLEPGASVAISARGTATAFPLV